MRMTAGLRTWVAGALAALAAVCGQAQDLKSLKDIYEKNAEEIRAGFQPKFDALQQQYQKSLEALKTSARSRGDLIKTKAAITELDRFQKAKSLPAAPDDGEIPEIKAFQSAYVGQYNRLETDMTVQLGALTTKYEQALDRIQKDLTKADKIDEATAVLEERGKAQAAIKGYTETLATLRGPSATNATLIAAARTPAMAAKQHREPIEQKGVVDYRSSESPPVVASTSTKRPAGVPSAAVPFRDNWFLIYEDDVGWLAAKRKCERLGGHLAIVPDAETWNFLDIMIKNVSVWLGATDRGHKGRWTWVDGTEMSFNAWGPQQPNNLEGRQDCLQTWKRKWDDLAEDGTSPGGKNIKVIKGFVCEWDKK